MAKLSEGLIKQGICCERTSLRQQVCCSRFGRDAILSILLSVGVVFLLAAFFYRSILAVPFLVPVGVLFYRRSMQRKREKSKEELAAQFKECIVSVSASLRAGYSVENAFIDCINDMELMYGERSPICLELQLIRRGLSINISIEELLMDLGKRSNVEEILQFAEIFSIAKRNGGNTTEIIGNTTEIIGKKMEMKQEIETVLSGKKMELNLMRGMPFLILFYVEMTTPGYFDVLYHNLAGVFIMTVCLAAYLGAYLLGDSVMRKLVYEMV